MSDSASSPGRRIPPSRGVTMSDVKRAADACLREGHRPTIERVRARLGTGSPNTIYPLLDAWWKRLGGRLDAGPAAEDDREPDVRSLESRIQELDLLLRNEQAAREAQARRIVELERELRARDKAAVKPMGPQGSKRAATKRRTAVKARRKR